MNSTGNDIVSLNAIDISRTLQPRFYSKILCAAEIAQYHESKLNQIPFEHYVWLLWSIKESAYKSLQRHNPDLIFSPAKFIVTQLVIPTTTAFQAMEGSGFEHLPAYKSTISFGLEILYSRSMMSEEFIFSVVNDEDDFDNTYWGISSIDGSEPDRQSAEVRNSLMKKLDQLVPYSDLLLTKSLHGCPILLSGPQQTNIPVSLAHHGKFVSYSFELADCS